MPYFLKDIAEYAFRTYKNELQDIYIVFPNKRARLYFNRYLSELTDKPVWSPSYFTINELMQHLTGLQIADPLILVFELYSSFIKVTKSTESFDNFYVYCEILLADFDDIDKYLIDPEDIFKNLANLKNIENSFDYLSDEQIKIISRFWKTFSPKNISDDQKSFLMLWESMFKIYKSFNESLRNSSIAYEGMVYREVINKINSGNLDNVSTAKYLFIGFNALNKCEKQLFRHLKNIKKAEFFWDYDGYYVNNTIHEAGYFLRNNIRDFPMGLSSLTHDNLTKQDKNISFIPVPSNIGQAKIISECLKKTGSYENIDFNKTVIVLADENLLLPVLNSLPGEVNEINVSMGYPFRETPVFNLIGKLADAQRNIRTGKNNEIQFYYKDVISILKLPVFAGILPDEANLKISEIAAGNMIYVADNYLHINNLFTTIFSSIKHYKEIPEYILRILEIIIEKYKQNKPDDIIENKTKYDFVFHAYTYIQRLNDVLQSSPVELSVNTMFKLIYNLLKNLSIPFSGEPLAGLQVMGILETRTLDFDNVIMLSLNEGIFPKSINIPSFIPYSIRYGFELPTLEHQDAIYAYYFYRLIQRAKNIFLVYNSRADGLFTGERSRFLHQLDYDPVFKTNEYGFSYDVSPFTKKPVTVKKNIRDSDLLIKCMDPALKTWLSPSAVNTYLNCPLRFYFRYIAGIKEPDEVTEEIDYLLFGNILHKAINIIYKPYINNIISKDILRGITGKKNIIESALNKAFSDEYLKESGKRGKLQIAGRNLIIKEVIQKYLIQIIHIDSHYAPFRIVSLEHPYSATVPAIIGNKKVNIQIGGKIDRIDEKEGKLRIIDYKTGKTENSFKGIDTLFNNDSVRNDAAFQVFLYSLILSENMRQPDIIPGLYFMREIFNENYDFRIILNKGRNDKQPINSYSLIADEFSRNLINTIQDIYNEDKDYIQTDNTDTCKHCPYSGICHRNGENN
jgi:CRISPR/Cas system-associated exonuclease Cas4 (RecB family)